MRWFVLRLVVVVWSIAGSPAAWAAVPGCAPDLVGPWSGKVWDAGVLKALRTRFSVASGVLTGTYRVEDGPDVYDGTLTDFVASGACAGTFRWRDRHGEGVVWVDFRPDQDRFDGEWGDTAPMTGYIFNGRRFRPVPIS